MTFSDIHTPRLILRSWRESDYPVFIAMNMDADVMRYFPGLRTAEQSMEQIRRIEAAIETDGFGLFAVERIDTGEFIGFTGLSRPRFASHFTPCVEIGWRLDKRHWGQGFAQEAARACLEYGFKAVGLARIYSFTSILNTPSINVMQKIGMSEAGHFEHPDIAEGSPLRTHVLYQIDKK